MNKDLRAKIQPYIIPTLFVVFVFGLLVSVLFLMMSQLKTFSPEGAFTAIAVFIFVFGGVALLYRATGLDEHAYAFGLPRGTVRATLAIGTLLTFLTLPAYLFSELKNLKPDQILAENQVLRSEPKNLPVGVFAVEVGEGRWIIYSVIGADARERLAFQIFTAISTTLAAISAFYFGARTAQIPTPSDEGGSKLAARAKKNLTAKIAQLRKVEAEAKTKLTRLGSALQELAEAHSGNPTIETLHKTTRRLVEDRMPKQLAEMGRMLKTAEGHLSDLDAGTAVSATFATHACERQLRVFEESNKAFELACRTVEHNRSNAKRIAANA